MWLLSGCSAKRFEIVEQAFQLRGRHDHGGHVVAANLARRIGEKDPEGAAVAAVQVIALGTLVAAAMGVAGALNARRLLALMGANEAILGESARFTIIMLGGNVVIVLIFLINAIFRAAGDAAIAMRVLDAMSR